MDSQCWQGTTAVTTFGATESTGCSSWCCEVVLERNGRWSVCNWWGYGCTAIGGCKNLRRHYSNEQCVWYHCCDRCIRYTRREKCSSYGCWCRQSNFYRLWCSPSNTLLKLMQDQLVIHLHLLISRASRSALMTLTKTEISLTLMGIHSSF